MTDCIKHVELPAVCGACINQVLHDATVHPERDLTSAYCEHGRALVTAQLTDHDGERVVYCWSVSGPMSSEQAFQAVHAAAGGCLVLDQPMH